MRPSRSLRWATIALCTVMVAALFLLPVINLYSYHWTTVEALQKLPRLMGSTSAQVSTWIVLSGMVLPPIAIAMACLLRRTAGKFTIVALFLFPAIFIVALLTTSKPVSPAIAAWLDIALAVAVAVLHHLTCKRQPQKTVK